MHGIGYGEISNQLLSVYAAIMILRNEVLSEANAERSKGR